MVQAIRINDDLGGLADAATVAATAVANLDHPAVFAPPVATFKNPKGATGQDLANGLCISVEIDAGDTIAAQQRLEGLLGPVTVAMVSLFFSSRRRHTRWNCDWSSDVCSSDLGFKNHTVGLIAQNPFNRKL